MSYTSDNMTKNAFSMLDMMMNVQRLSLQAISAYQPFVSAFLDSTKAAERAARPLFGAAPGRPGDLRELHDTNEEQVIGVGEEVLNVGTRMVPGKTTRVRRVVVQTPVQQDVTLHTETVVLERRKPIVSSGNDLLTEVTVEMSDFNEVPVVSKAVHPVEEVLLRKEVTARVETIHDTVRRDTLEIEQPSNLPVVVHAAAKQQEESPADETQDKKQLAPLPQTANRASDQLAGEFEMTPEEIERRHGIRERAHEIWIERGRPEGHDVEFWLEAERELESQRAPQRRRA